MEREGHDNVAFFYGKEVEHTPAFGRQTLFVVGLQSVEDIAAKLSSGSTPVEHIYFGANMSFPNLAFTDAEQWNQWENMINYFLQKDYWCTLDIDVACVSGLNETGLCEHHNFIPMISVKMPYARLLGYNATVKIDDQDFKATNPGVWCHSLHSLTRRSSFTPWSEYSKDQPL